mmetsp:Transcript_28371/g.64296  ORF Transcript_28371/g.64296 Transcript_28371/m.64296 type:complete len:83 (+) Transcript_28371:370-618(+)
MTNKLVTPCAFRVTVGPACQTLPTLRLGRTWTTPDPLIRSTSIVAGGEGIVAGGEGICVCLVCDGRGEREQMNVERVVGAGG